MSCNVFWQKTADISKKYTAAIFRIEDKVNQRGSRSIPL
jgi:hypothetical protein